MDLVIDKGSPPWLPETSLGFQPFKTATFMQLHNRSQPLTRGGQVLSIGLAPDLWQIKMASDVLAWPDANRLQTWLERLEGGKFLFKAWHPQLRYPQSYRTGFAGLVRATGGAFNGTCNITSVGETRRSLVIANLPAGFKISFGDMISYPFGTLQLLHRIQDDVVANGSGIAEIPVTPTLPIPLVVTDPVTVATFFKPWCLATIDAGSIDAPLDGNTGTITFTATESY